MTDSTVYRLLTTIREMTAHRHDVDPPDHDTYRSLMAQIDRERDRIQRQDVHELVVLVERLTGCKGE